MQQNILMFCLIAPNHRQIQCQWGIYVGVALAIDIEMQTVIAQVILTHEASDKVPFNSRYSQFPKLAFCFFWYFYPTDWIGFIFPILNLLD